MQFWEITIMTTGKHWPSVTSRIRSPQGRPPKKATYETIEEVVDNAIHTHLYAAQQFSRLCDKSKSQRVRMLLQNIIRHEQEMELLLRDFVKEADKSVLRTWLQYTQEIHPEELLRAALPPEGDALTIESLSQASQDLHQYFVELFETAEREAGSQEAQQFLASILQIERARRRQFTRVINSLMDM